MSSIGFTASQSGLRHSKERITGNLGSCQFARWVSIDNALVLTGLANFGVVGHPETEPHRRRLTSFLESEISQTHIRLLLPFLPKECASPPAFAVKAVRFAPVNANYAALTARTPKRRGPPRRAFASFFQAEITLEKRKKEEPMTERQHATWGELLRDAVEKPGRMLEAYTAFHNYSFGNALLALEQCIRRNLQPGPLNTYQRMA